MKKIALIILFFFISTNHVFSENIYFIDISKVLNTSKAGKGAQDYLKNKIEKDNKKYQAKEKDLLNKEKEIIAKKNVLTGDEYKKQIAALRKQVNALQKEKQKSLNDIAKIRAKARNDLIKALNPIIKNYMGANNIKIVVDKKSVILGETSLDITNKIIIELNKNLTSLKLN